MARKASRGFDYISLDTDFVSDRKISRLRRYTNEFAPYVYITPFSVRSWATISSGTKTRCLILQRKRI